jgi:hypothetical protein
MAQYQCGKDGLFEYRYEPTSQLQSSKVVTRPL